jgi:hypothetical protein
MAKRFDLPPADPRSLRPGDILLHRTRGEISKLVAWAGNSPYSHAAIVYDDENLAEAMSAGVRKFRLADRLGDEMRKEFDFIDAYRGTGRPDGLAGPAMDAVRAVADKYMGRPYPLHELWYLGLVCAIRDKIPLSNEVKEFLRVVTDAFIDHDPAQQVCSEFVYRCYAEAQTAPSLKPTIVVATGAEEPFPSIDLWKLWQEYEEAKSRGEPHAEAAAARMPPEAAPPASEAVSDETLRANYAAIRERLGIGGAAAARAVDAPVVDADPNPRTILPADLQNSPDFKPLGRVLVGS